MRACFYGRQIKSGKLELKNINTASLHLGRKKWHARDGMDFNLHFEGSILSVQCVINSAASFMSKTKNIATIYYLSPPNSRHVLIICSFGCLGNERPPWKIPLLCFSFSFFLFGTMENPTLVKIILCML